MQVLLDKDQATGNLALAELIPQVEPYMRPNILIYFVDFTLSALLGNTLLVLASMQPNWSLVQILLVFASSLALFRTSAFMHEVFHLEKKIKASSLYFNLLHGFLHRTPFYNYSTHRYHHMPRTYGTQDDPEYEKLADKPPIVVLVILPMVSMLVAPVFLFVRWGIVPFLLPFIGKKARDWIYVNASTLAMHFPYRRPEPTESERRSWYMQDAACAVYTLAIFYLVATGVLSASIFGVWYFVAYLLCMMNYYRALLNHRYVTGFASTTHKQQVIDSITYPLTVFNFLFYPVGLNYHALHHMFPQIPYHHMGKAHRFLMQTLPADHPYRTTVISSFRTGVRQMFTRQFP